MRFCNRTQRICACSQNDIDKEGCYLIGINVFLYIRLKKHTCVGARATDTLYGAVTRPSVCSTDICDRYITYYMSMVCSPCYGADNDRTVCVSGGGPGGKFSYYGRSGHPFRVGDDEFSIRAPDRRLPIDGRYMAFLIICC